MGSSRGRLVKFLPWKRGLCCKRVCTVCTVIVADTAGLPEHAGSRGGSSLNCEAHSKACEIKRAKDSYSYTKLTYSIVNAACLKATQNCFICCLFSLPYFIKTKDLVYKHVHSVYCYCVKLSLTPACALLSI